MHPDKKNLPMSRQVLTTKLRGHSGSVVSVDMVIGGDVLVSSASDNSVRLWDIRVKNNAIRLLKVPISSGDIGICRLRGNLASVSSGNHLFGFDLRLSDSVIVCDPAFTYCCIDSDEEINDYSVTSSGDMFAIPTDSGAIRLVSCSTFRELSSSVPHSNIAAVSRFLPSGAGILSGGYDCRVSSLKFSSADGCLTPDKLFPVAPLIGIEESQTQSINPPFVTSMELTGDQAAIGCGDGSVLVLDIRKGGSRVDSRRVAWGGAGIHSMSVSALCWDADGRTVWSAGNDGVLVNMAETRINVRYDLGFKPNTLAMLSPGRLAVAGIPNEIHILDFNR